MEFHFQKVNNSNLSKSKRSKSEQRQANLFSLGGPEIKSLFLKQNKRNFLLKIFLVIVLIFLFQIFIVLISFCQSLMAVVIASNSSRKPS